MKFNLSNNRCVEFKTKVHSLEQEITASIQFIRCIENQNWEVLKIDHSNKGSHLLDALQKMGEKLALYFNQEKDQMWIAEGVERTSTVLRQNQSDLSLLTEKALCEIVKSVGASKGAIFVSEEGPGNQSVLEMKATYAIAKKNHSIGIEPGQGLVGQCFLKGEKIYMTQVPKDYLQIASGLGEAIPRCVLLLPLKSKNQKVGVLELASFTSITSAQFLFLDKVSETISTEILAFKGIEKTEKLLEQSEIMTLELTKREKELEQNLNEMRTLRQDQLRKQRELEIAYTEITEKNKEIEKIQIRETELIETKLKTHQEITDKIISRLKSKVAELQGKIERTHTAINSVLSN